MRSLKKIIFVCGLLLFSYFHLKITKDNDLAELYSGLVFHNSPVFYVPYLLLFACYSLYTYREYSTFLGKYGVILIFREKSRSKLYHHMIKILMKALLFIEIVKIGCYLFLQLILKGEVYCREPLEFLKMIVFHLLIYGFVLLLQMNIELFSSGDIAVFVSMAVYVISLGMSNLIGTETFLEKVLQSVNIFNLTMQIRLNTLIDSFASQTIIMVALSGIIFLVFQLGKAMFLKKDLL